MQMSVVEKTPLVDRYTDSELEQMTWRELGELSRYSSDTLWYRVKREGMTRRQALAHVPPKYHSELSRIADHYKISYSTLATRHRRYPDVPLEELAQRPILKGAERAKPGLMAIQEKRATQRSP